MIQGLAGVVGLLALAGVVVAILPSTDDRPDQGGAIGECENAHLDPRTGIATGLACDDRAELVRPAPRVDRAAIGARDRRRGLHQLDRRA